MLSRLLRFSRLRRHIVLGLLLPAAGCSPMLLLGPVSSEPGVEAHRDQPYGALPRQKLDVYAPKIPAARPRAVVVFFYGGGWQTGDRADYRFAGESLAAQGFVAVVPDYRVYPQAKFPVFLQDGAAAVRWVHDHAGEFGGDPRQLFLMGHSAGAHIAAMLALDPQFLAAQGMSRAHICGFAGLAGPYDFLPLKSRKMIAIFGGADGIPHTQPINFVSKDAPPALLLHGSDDTRVLPRNTQRLAARMQASGGHATELIYQGVGHSGILLALSPAFERIAPVRADVAGFVRSHEMRCTSILTADPMF